MEVQQKSACSAAEKADASLLLSMTCLRCQAIVLSFSVGERKLINHPFENNRERKISHFSFEMTGVYYCCHSERM
jgi:hypothetical protein